jgi:hypothetical protein
MVLNSELHFKINTRFPLKWPCSWKNWSQTQLTHNVKHYKCFICFNKLLRNSYTSMTSMVRSRDKEKDDMRCLKWIYRTLSEFPLSYLIICLFPYLYSGWEPEQLSWHSEKITGWTTREYRIFSTLQHPDQHWSLSSLLSYRCWGFSARHEATTHLHLVPKLIMRHGPSLRTRKTPPFTLPLL